MIQKTIMAYIENIEDNLNFNEHREFGELISTPFSFFFKNFKAIIFPMLKYAGPIIVIGMIFLSFAITNLVENMEDVAFEGISLYYFNYTLISGLLLGFGYVMAVAIIYSYAVLYEENDGNNFSENDVKELAFSVYLNLLFAQIIKVILIVLGLFAIIIGAIYVSIAVSYVDFIIVKERTNSFDAIKKSFGVVRGNWWKTFGLLFIIQIILSFALQILYVPVVMLTASMGFVGVGGDSLSWVLLIVMTVASILSVLAYSIPNIAVVYLYFSINTSQKNPDLINRINNISGTTTKGYEYDENDDGLKRF